MQSTRHVRLFRNGANQALRIPREFELPGIEAILRKEGNPLIVESNTADFFAGVIGWLATVK